MLTELTCHCVQTTPLHVYSDTASNGLRYPGSFICIGRLLCVLLSGSFFMLSWIPVMFTESFSLSQSLFNYDVSDTYSNDYHVELVNVLCRKCDFSLFPITKEMQNKLLVAALLCKITINWVCSEKCTVTIYCKLRNIDIYKINRKRNRPYGCMIELLKQ